MEKEPIFENKETPEQQLVRLLKEKGPEGPEYKELLNDWLKKEELKVRELEDEFAAMELNLKISLKCARIYFEAGYLDDAYENFEAARMQAHHSGMKDLYDAIMKEMDEKNLLKK